MDRPFFLPHHLFLLLPPLLPLQLYLHHLFKILLKAFHLFIFLFLLFWTLPQLPFLVPLLILILYLLLFPTLLWTGLLPLHPILYLYLLLIPYIDLYQYMLPLGPPAFPLDLSLTYTPQFFPLIPCPYLTMAVPLPGSLLPPLGPLPVVPRKGPLETGPGIGSGAGPEIIPIMPPEDNVPDLSLLAASYPVILLFSLAFLLDQPF